MYPNVCCAPLTSASLEIHCRCLFMEAKPMTAADFKRTSEEEEAVARGVTSARSRGETRSAKQNQQPPNSIKVRQNRQL